MQQFYIGGILASIDWKRLLDSSGIEYIEHGSSVVKGNIAVHCPMCRNADAGHHMGINLSNNYWGCWRNSSHRGKSPVRLLMALLNVSYIRAREIAGLDEEYVDPEGYEAMKKNLFMGNNPDVVIHDEEVLIMPDQFAEIRLDRVRTQRFFNYLVQRGFNRKDISSLCNNYQLRAAVSGNFKDRIIIPYYEGRKLVTWTGRAIGATEMRYLDLSIESSITTAKKTLYNYNALLKGGHVLLVAEGPMDSLKTDLYAKEFGVRAVALSTNSISEDQIYILEEFAPNFNKVLVVMDAGNSLGVIDSFKMKEKLAQIKNIAFCEVPFGKKDCGDLTPDEVKKFAAGLVKKYG